MTLRYGSVCSGYDAATLAWHPLGWRPAFFSEIEAFPSAILAHHYGSNMPGEPLAGNGVPNLGDMTRFEEWPDYAIDLLVGGTPCQDYSVAGLRAGMDGARGSLTLTYAAIARRYRPRRLVWENVPGVLSINSGRDFASFLGLLSGQRIEVPRDGWGNAGVVPGYGRAYGLAWRVLDAQYIRVDGYARAVPQRRRRVILVGYLGDWRRAAAVLLERESLSGHPAPRREAGKGVAGAVGGGPDGGRISGTVSSKWAKGSGGPGGDELYNMVAHALRAEGFDASEDGTGRGTPIVPIDLRQASRGEKVTNNRATGSGGAPGHGVGSVGDPAFTVTARAQAIAFDTTQITSWAVRRLTPTECERLQGVPDGFTLVPWRGGMAPDGPRYKALGNSMAVNVMRWVGERIAMVEAIAGDAA